MNPFKIAWLHFTRKKTSSLIAILGIALAIASSGVLLRLYLLSAARFLSLPVAAQALVGAKGSGLDILLGGLNFEGEYPDFLPTNLYLTLKAQVNLQFEGGATEDNKLVKLITPLVLIGAKDEYRLYGTDETLLTARAQRPVLASGRWAENPGEVVLGSKTAEHFALKENDNVVISSWTNKEKTKSFPLNLKVTGILKETKKSWDRNLFSNLVTAERVFAQNPTTIWGPNVLHYYLVDLIPNSETAFSRLINQRTVAQVAYVQQELESLQKLTGAGRDLGLAVTAIILVLGLFTATAMMMARFESMTTQLAVLRALGFSQLQLTCVMIFEALLVGVSATILGLTLDAVSFPWVCALLGSSLPSAEVASVSLLASFPIWIAAIIGTLFSVLIPLYRLYRQDLHLSLRNL